VHPLLLCSILLVHAYALWMMARQRYVAPAAPPATSRFITYMLPLPPLVKPAPARSSTNPAPARAPVAQVATPLPAPAQDAASVAPDAPAAVTGLDMYHPSAAEILEQARRDMPRIERELRHGVPTALKRNPDSLRAKLERGFEEAYVGGDQRTTVDFYTSPDNVIYMRSTRHGKSRCTMNGGPVSLRSAAGGGGGDTPVNCPPPDAGWKATPG
jgi:hypothetical protein